MTDVVHDHQGEQNPATEPVLTNQPTQILAGKPGFVPSAFESYQKAGLHVDWQTAMKRAIRSASELRQILGLPELSPEETPKGEESFATFVPWEYLARIKPGEINDPLLRQVLPVPEEEREESGFIPDPVGDLTSLATGGLLHKYAGRALVITTAACGVHCRYCFRREFPYSSAGSRTENWNPAIKYLREQQDVEEVLLSGGDPLTLTDSKLDELITRIEAIPHIRRLRVHTRMPVVIPQRVTQSLVDRLARSRLAIWFVIHANHPNELDAHVLESLGRLSCVGIPVLNQAVLLRGVNDQANVLIELCRKLVDHQIQPYYLHQLDRVRGASHFEVPVAEGKKLMTELRRSLPGYAVPTYVREEPGKDSKTPITDGP